MNLQKYIADKKNQVYRKSSLPPKIKSFGAWLNKLQIDSRKYIRQTPETIQRENLSRHESSICHIVW